MDTSWLEAFMPEGETAVPSVSQQILAMTQDSTPYEAAPRVDERFMLDLEVTPGVRQRAVELAQWSREESERRHNLRRYKIELQAERDRMKKEYRRKRSAIIAEAKASGDRVTDKAAEAVADMDEALSSLEESLDVLETRLQEVNAELEYSGDVKDDLKMMHRSVLALLGDLQDERRFS